ncbi:MAG: TonB-dependent receptor [Bacteroidales bacterium]|nr:TonB-dependent receptor [Bacteroidales bacterium]
MCKQCTIWFIVIMFLSKSVYAQKAETGAGITGHVGCCGQDIPLANVVLKGTAIGTVTDETGHFHLVNLPVGKVTLYVRRLGYTPLEKSLVTVAGKTMEIDFELEEDILSLDEIVVSADRTAQKRTDAPVIVNIISPKLFTATHSLVLGEGLNFSPGLRVENNCQNCGFTQVRMNGLEGAYSQVLINSRPIFSGLAGVYGLELIPSNMIERVEIVRGGGSAMYGSNAIAGTINIILKDPVADLYEAGTACSLVGIGLDGSGGKSPDFSVSLNSSMVSDDRKMGMSIYGFTRKRYLFDANEDGFSEIAPMNHLSLGTRVFQRFGYRSKLALDFFTIREQRDGGNKQDLPMHERDIAEAVEHELKTIALTFEQYVRQYDLLSIYTAWQFLNRDSYYGANRSLKGYGNSKDRTCNTGIQYKAVFSKSSIISGIENSIGLLDDRKLGYPDYTQALIVNDTIQYVPHAGNATVANQSSVTIGMFSQYELKLSRVTLTMGGRYDHYTVKNMARENLDAKRGGVFSPRISLMFELTDELRARAGYSHGYRAPQIFDEDLHIETSGTRQVIHVNDPGLKQETSNSFTASLDFNGLVGRVHTGLLTEAFYTRLENPFVNKIGVPDDQGLVVYTRRNAEEGATVKGFNMELKIKPLKTFSFNSGFTLQSSLYDVAREFDEKHFLRTPDQYGFFALEWNFTKQCELSVTGNYTGSMLLPYFGPETNPVTGELRKSSGFFDASLKLSFTMQLNGMDLLFYAGIKNIFNAYQQDFDAGPGRDPAYIYGPLTPRTIYIGIKTGNFMNRSNNKFPESEWKMKGKRKHLQMRKRGNHS